MGARRVAGTLVLVLVLAGCKVDATLQVRVREDGGGVVRAAVRLDRAALELLAPKGADPEAGVRLEDLRAAGWRVRWSVDADRSGATVRLAKPFARAGEAARVVAELTGDSGLLRDVTVRRDDGGLRTRWSFTGRAGVRPKVGIADDPELAAAFGARGGDVPAAEAWLTDRLARALRARLQVDLPAGAPRQWALADGTDRALAVATSRLEVGRVATLAAGALLGTGALGLGVVGEARRRHRARAQRVAPRRSAAPGRRPR